MTEVDSNEVKWVKQETWTKQAWKPKPALVHKNGGRVSLYIGQTYDPQYIDYVEEGWTHDHCEVCYKDLYETDDPEHGEGYTNGDSWICSECHLKYVQNT